MIVNKERGIHMKKVTKNNSNSVKIMAAILAGLMVFSCVTTLIVVLVDLFAK